MGVVLAVLGWALLGVLAVLVLVIVTPLHLRGVVAAAPFQASLVVAPFGGLVPIRIPLKRGDVAPEKPAKPKRKRRRSTSGTTDVARVLPEVPALLTALLAAFRVEALRVDARFGLSDPADTGALLGILAPVVYGVPQGARVSLCVAPDFDGPGFGGSAEGAVSVTLGRMIGPVLRFGWRVYGPVS